MEYLPGYTPVRSVTIYKNDGSSEKIGCEPDEKFITIGTSQGSQSGVWLVFTKKSAYPFCWADISKIEIEHL